jgi:Icc protein
MISWIHFGDLHISGREEQNYADFLTLIDEANRHMNGSADFALLPGDNADDGEEDEYRLVRDAVAQCRFPVHAITGDHDMAAGSLDLFRRYLSAEPYKSFMLGAYRFVFLNSVAKWRPPVFGLGGAQMEWLKTHLGSQAVVFMHAYPSEHGGDAAELRELFRERLVLLVEMGHTHYNELANDGRTIYAATRSTGQIEEGPAGFSITTLDDGVVSWKFKPMGKWPLAMVTSPADWRLIVNPASPTQLVRGRIEVRARVWGEAVEEVELGAAPMKALGGGMWSAVWDAEEYPDGRHELTVTARTSDGRIGGDTIQVLVNKAGEYDAPIRSAVDYENALGAWPEKHILGTQLGPNENGHGWPPRRERVAR